MVKKLPKKTFIVIVVILIIIVALTGTLFRSQSFFSGQFEEGRYSVWFTTANRTHELLREDQEKLVAILSKSKFRRSFPADSVRYGVAPFSERSWMFHIHSQYGSYRIDGSYDPSIMYEHSLPAGHFFLKRWFQEGSYEPQEESVLREALKAFVYDLKKANRFAQHCAPRDKG